MLRRGAEKWGRNEKGREVKRVFPQTQERRYCIEPEAKANDVEKRGTNGTHTSLTAENLRCIAFILD